ncbi:MAG: hypothetical protein IAC87_06440 [Muribaculum sp.]|uniref:Uncharacterized protein n=1 Tax=Candidatus Merdivivens faecigallinarum TaxID=2840871 RepID=A0A9D9J1P2_9BACT|nr:hypothetical protein [Candidatus Merdivivens faecigallinarum]
MANFKKISIKTNFIACFHQNLHQCLVTATITAGESAWDSWKYGSLSRKKRRNGGKINISGGKVPQIRGKMVHFPGEEQTRNEHSGYG